MRGETIAGGGWRCLWMTNKCYTVTLLSVGESLVTFEQGPSGGVLSLCGWPFFSLLPVWCVLHCRWGMHVMLKIWLKFFFFFKVLSYGKHISISDETSLSLVFVPFCTATVSLNFLLMLRLCLTFHMFEWGGQSVGTDTWLELLSLTRGQFAKVFVLVHPFWKGYKSTRLEWNDRLFSLFTFGKVNWANYCPLGPFSFVETFYMKQPKMVHRARSRGTAVITVVHRPTQTHHWGGLTTGVWLWRVRARQLILAL